MATWRDCKLGDLLQIKHGFAFLGEHFGSTGTHVVLTPGNFLEEGGFKEKSDKAKWYSGPIPDDYVLNEGDLIVAMKVPFTFPYLATTTDDFVTYLANNATGAAYPAVNSTTFEKANLLTPPACLLKRFGEATIPIVEQIHTRQRQIQNLRRTRDLLLPRLLSGRVNLNDD